MAVYGRLAAGAHHPVATGQSVFMNPQSGDPDHGARARGTQRPAWRSAAFLAGAVALVAVMAVAGVAAASARGGSRGAGGGTRAISVTAGSVRTVDLDAVPGQLTIVGVTGGRVTLTGQLDWTGYAPVASTQLVRSHQLRLSYRCARASPCTANWRLAVPWRTAVELRQPAGHVVVSGLAGPLRIIAGSVDVSATGLRSPWLQAAITSGHLNAAFDAPPRQVSVNLTSAQATLLLPGTVGYAVSARVTAGYVHVGIPQAASAAHTVTARIVSGELELLAS
jgi:hypothetical protein